MATLPPEALAALGDDLLALLSAHASEERLALPLLRMVQLLLEAKRLDPLLGGGGKEPIGAADKEPFGARLLEAVRGVTRGSKDVPTLQTGVTLQVRVRVRVTARARATATVGLG